MAEIFGDFVENLPKHAEYLIFGFSPNSISLQQRWRNNGLSADFLADYVKSFFISQPDFELQEEVKGAVSYIANELLENAMKFCEEEYGHPTSIQLHLYNENLVFLVRNSLNPERQQSFQDFIKTLDSEDLADLYIRQLELNALDEEHTHSGLGYLTMMQDYEAKLGWKFEVVKNKTTQESVPIVTTMVQLGIF